MKNRQNCYGSRLSQIEETHTILLPFSSHSQSYRKTETVSHSQEKSTTIKDVLVIVFKAKVDQNQRCNEDKSIEGVGQGKVCNLFCENCQKKASYKLSTTFDHKGFECQLIEHLLVHISIVFIEEDGELSKDKANQDPRKGKRKQKKYRYFFNLPFLDRLN